MHWSSQYLGKPYDVDGYGPDAFNCWGLVWEVYRAQFGIDLPKYGHVDPRQLPQIVRQIASEECQWERITEPKDGCVVGLSSGRSLHHVGIYLDVDGGLVLHARDQAGVIATPRAHLARHGWGKVNFYLHKSWRTSST